MSYQESENVELKLIVVDDIKKEVAAFANSDGGTLYIGVRDETQCQNATIADKRRFIGLQ